MGGFVAQIVSSATTALQRQLIVYGLWLASGLLVLFAAGYALNAIHASLMFRLGSMTASLVVAGGLLFFAIGLIIAGYLVSRTRSPSVYQRLQASPEISRTAKLLTRPKRTMAPAAAGALAGAVAVITLVFMRRRTAPFQGTVSQMRQRDRFD